MKRKDDVRHQRRTKLVQTLFANSFVKQAKETYDKKASQVIKILAKIDSMIEEAAPQFPIEKIAKIDVAILRLAIFELVFEKKEPAKVIIDEAIELAKEFGGEGSPPFINGVLATIYKKIQKKSKS